jgi:thioredoxin reductase (NADPH)
MYDLIIIGGGPAGIAASIYAARYGLKTVIISKTFGGEIANSTEMGNFPGFPKISGAELIAKWQEHVIHTGAEIIIGKEVKEIKNSGEFFNIVTSEESYQAKAIILALGLSRKKLGIPGEKEFGRKGVSYCVTCDGPLFKDKTVIVVGGGDAGISGAVFMSKIAKKIYLIEAMDKLAAEKIWQDKLTNAENIEIILGNKITEIKGEESVKSVILEKEVNGQKEIPCDGVFIEIGSAPNPSLAKSIGVETDEKGFIKIGADQSTNISGIFAAGDATTGSNFFLQAITAMSEGAIAANSVNKYLKKKS